MEVVRLGEAIKEIVKTPYTIMTIEEKITLGVAVVTGVKWVYEYTKKLTWDKNKFLLERYEKFKSKESTKSMQLLLDWNKILIENGYYCVGISDARKWSQIHSWLKTNVDEKEYVWAGMNFYFTNHDDAVLFALKWA